jgi:hypothetical protein
MSKVKKIDISAETSVREERMSKSLPIGFTLVGQEFNVIQDKINELVEQMNLLTKGRG